MSVYTGWQLSGDGMGYLTKQVIVKGVVESSRVVWQSTPWFRLSTHQTQHKKVADQILPRGPLPDCATFINQTRTNSMNLITARNSISS